MSEIKRVPEIYPIPSQLPDHQPDDRQEEEEASEQYNNPVEDNDGSSKLSEQRLQADLKRKELWGKLEQNKKES